MAVWSFNRGEWTEAYVFLHLLGTGRIYGATEKLTKDEQTYINIVNIIRDEPSRLLVFERFLQDDQAYISVKEGDCKIMIITAPELNEKAAFLYDSIKGITAGNRKISVVKIQEYLEGLNIDTPKANLSADAKEKYGSKADIIVTSEDSSDHARRTEGFSIKSHLGSSPTLFNGSQTSGFRYEIKNCNETLMHTINALDSFVEMISYIKENLSLTFSGCRNEIFADNLDLVDSSLAQVLNGVVLSAIGYNKKSATRNLPDICAAVTEDNPLGKRHPELFYVSKIRDFLFAAFAGMTACTIWNGRKKLTGGYIDVNPNGEMLYYRAISDEVFCNYLLQYTYLDLLDRGRNKDVAVVKARAYLESREATDDEITFASKKTDGTLKPVKGNYGYVYQKDGIFYIDINFQIRFKNVR